MICKPLRLSGLVAATFTPMDEDGSLALDRVEGIVEHLCRWKIAGLYVVGSTGEGVSLGSDERRAVAEAYVKAAAGRLPVIVQVGHNSLVEARRLAAHAESLGASAVSAVSPSYFKPESVESLVASVAEMAAGAPHTPFYYYHIPRLTAVAVDMADFLSMASDRIPTLVGVKYTTSMLHELLESLEYDHGRFEILFGVDEMLMQGSVTGAQGAVGSTYNFSAPIYHQVIQALGEGNLDRARLWQSRANAVIKCVLRHGGLSGQKAVMELIGVDCGPTRLPLPRLAQSDRDSLHEELTKMGFFDWIKS